MGGPITDTAGHCYGTLWRHVGHITMHTKKIDYEYLVVNGERSHLHGHGHNVNCTVDEAGFKFLIEVGKLFRSARERK